MTRTRRAIKSVLGICSAVALAGWAGNGLAQSDASDGSTETDLRATQDVLSQSGIDLDSGAAQQNMGSPTQQRRLSKQANRAAALERMRAATKREISPAVQVPPIPEPVPRQGAAAQTTPTQAVPPKRELGVTTTVAAATTRAAAPATTATAAAPARLADIDVSFKLVSQAAAKGTSDSWVAAPIVSTFQEGAFSVEARVQGRDTQGRLVDISPEWIAGDRSVQISPSHGNAVTITVRESGESNVVVKAKGFSKELSISAINQGKAIQVRIFD